MSEEEKLTENQPEQEVLPLEFKRLTAASSLGAFSCGQSEIDQYWKRDALEKHESRRFRVTTVNFVDHDDLVAFYSLTAKAENVSILEKTLKNIALDIGDTLALSRLAFLLFKDLCKAKVSVGS